MSLFKQQVSPHRLPQ